MVNNMEKSKFSVGDQQGTYVVNDVLTDDDILKMANEIACRQLQKGRELTSVTATRSYLQTLNQCKEHEVFGVIFLDQQHRVIAAEEMFRGTINSASVYPREVVKRALVLNCAALIAYHNHPSGSPEPSSSDRSLTVQLVAALNLVDIKVLDHIVVGTEGTVSFAALGYL
jgi:DNA repair protein RadC